MTQRIRIERNDWGARFHVFEQADGRWRRCGGAKFCRECNREADRRPPRRIA